MGKIIAGISVAIAATLFFSIFIVKEVNQAIVLQFGDPKKIITKPGLNYKIPFWHCLEGPKSVDWGPGPKFMDIGTSIS